MRRVGPPADSYVVYWRSFRMTSPSGILIPGRDRYAAAQHWEGFVYPPGGYIARLFRAMRNLSNPWPRRGRLSARPGYPAEAPFPTGMRNISLPIVQYKQKTTLRQVDRDIAHNPPLRWKIGQKSEFFARKGKSGVVARRIRLRGLFCAPAFLRKGADRPNPGARRRWEIPIRAGRPSLSSSAAEAGRGWFWPIHP